MLAYEVWNPHIDANHGVNIIEIVERSEGLRILVQEYETEKFLTIFFDTHVAYQRRSESWVAGEACALSGLGKGSFYTVKNSRFVSLFQTESLSTIENILHFSIVTDSLCIDILASEDPRIEYVR
jgi:hypothetical protein